MAYIAVSFYKVVDYVLTAIASSLYIRKYTAHENTIQNNTITQV